jgi:hypothetical protein
MNALWQTPAIVLAVLSWLSAPPQSLADAARREALRRQMMPKASASLTNAGLPTELPPAAVTQPEVPAPPAGAPPATPPAAPPAEPAAPPREEKWWRARMDAALTTLERNRLLAESVQSRINSLQADVVNIDDPAQQALKRQQLGQSVNELERLRAQIAADEKAIQDIRTDARKNNIPPGWIR